MGAVGVAQHLCSSWFWKVVVEPMVAALDKCFGQGMFRPGQLLGGGATFPWLAVGRQ